MTIIKRRISAFVAAFAMVGAVTVPSSAKYVINETAITASAASEYEIYDFSDDPVRVDVKAKTKFKAEPFESSKTVASVKKETTGRKVYLTKGTITEDGIWYYSKYDKGWIKRDCITVV